VRKVDEDLAREGLEQIFDNALIQAGLVDDSRSMVPRINKILERALVGSGIGSGSGSGSGEDAGKSDSFSDTFKVIEEVDSVEPKKSKSKSEEL